MTCVDKIDWQKATQQKMVTLDIGCGKKPRGNINIDIQRQNIENFVLADAHNLPFRDNAFRKVYAHSVLEHLKNPLKALQEWSRVGKTAQIYIPSAFSLDTSIGHLYTWNHITFKNILKQAYHNVEVQYTHRGCIMPKCLPPFMGRIQFLFTRLLPKNLVAQCWN